MFEDDHPNAAGYTIVAEAVRDHLASHLARWLCRQHSSRVALAR
jgi:hypothetical protein